MQKEWVGLGIENAKIAVYIANRPPLVDFEQLTRLRCLQPGEIARIANETGNHWRKVFNVYAKLVFELYLHASSDTVTWQEYRDNNLLQADGNERLMFSAPNQAALPDNAVHIITGKTYAKTLGLLEGCEVLNEDFMINRSSRLIICPYFDYRQLSNLKIDQLVGLIRSLD